MRIGSRRLHAIDTYCGPSSAYPGGMLVVGKRHQEEEEPSGTAPPHRPRHTGAPLSRPAPGRSAACPRPVRSWCTAPGTPVRPGCARPMAPARQVRGVAVAGRCPGAGLADLGAPAQRPCGLGHARADSAPRRPGPQRPERGPDKRRAAARRAVAPGRWRSRRAARAGAAERFDRPPRGRLAPRAAGPAARGPPPVARLPSVPGLGTRGPGSLRSERPARPRFPRGPDGVASGRWGTGGPAAAGPRALGAHLWPGDRRDRLRASPGPGRVGHGTACPRLRPAPVAPGCAPRSPRADGLPGPGRALPG